MLANCKTHVELLEGLPVYIGKKVAPVSIEFSSNSRSRLAISSIDLSLEHYRAISMLVGGRLLGSASALMRCQFECLVRGLWIDGVANEAELIKIENDEPLRSRISGKKGKTPSKRFSEYISELKERKIEIGQDLGPHFEEFWGAFNSYTHGGALPLLRRIGVDRIGLTYDADDAEQLSALSNFYAISALNFAALAAASTDLSEIVNRLSGIYMSILWDSRADNSCPKS